MKKFNKLTFVKTASPRIRKNGYNRKRAFFQCDCGNIKEYDYSSVKTGKTKQCLKCAYKKASKTKKTHGKTNHKLYRKWCDMKKRCNNPNVDRYKNYGARGIKVCDEWSNSFEKFYKWSIDNGWNEKLELDRINVDGDYSPDNCRFITNLEQRWNRKSTYFVNINGLNIPLGKLLYYNNQSDKYSNIWNGLKRGYKDINYYINYYNLNINKIKK